MYFSTLILPFVVPVAYAQLNTLAKAAGLKYFGTATDNPELNDTALVAALSNTSEFGQITPGNSQKAGHLVVAVRVHVLIITDGTWTNATLVAALQNHVTSEVTHYKGQCYAWDVVNEAFEANGTFRNDVFFQTIGPDYIRIAFETAAAADPDVKLYYNDFSIETPGVKTTAVLSLVKSLKASGTKIDGVGLQSHFVVGSTPSKAVQVANLESFTALGVEVAITELDVRMNLPVTAAQTTQQSTDYQNTVAACVAVKDCYSWVPSTFPGTGSACLFDANLVRKPAYFAVVAALTGAKANATTAFTVTSGYRCDCSCSRPLKTAGSTAGVALVEIGGRTTIQVKAYTIVRTYHTDPELNMVFLKTQRLVMVLSTLAIFLRPVISACENPVLRKEWNSVSQSERDEYIKAAQCLPTKPSKIGLSTTLYDDFSYIHALVFDEVHIKGDFTTAAFLPWHRYFIHLYELALKECGYGGPLLYWDWTLDAADPFNAAIWDPVKGIGGDGTQSPNCQLIKGLPQQCVSSGPFASLRPAYYANRAESHSISRCFTCDSPTMFNYTWTPTAVSETTSYSRFFDFSSSLYKGPHLGIHDGCSWNDAMGLGPCVSSHENVENLLDEVKMERMGFFSKKDAAAVAAEKQSPTKTPMSRTPARVHSLEGKNAVANFEDEGHVTVQAILLGAIASIGGFMFGYESGQISGFLAMTDFLERFGQDGKFTPVRQGTIVALLCAGTLVGCLASGWVCDKIGRRYTISFSAFFYIIGVVIEITSSRQWVQFAMGRFTAGLGIGALSTSVPMYQSESVPKAIRAAVVSSYQLLITLGIWTAYMINYGTSAAYTNSAQWRIPNGLSALWAIILGTSILFMPESPRFAYRMGREEEARRNMARLNGVEAYSPLIDAEIQEIEEKLQAEKAGGDHPWYEIFTGPRMLYRTILGMVLQAGQQLTGANFFFYYGTTIFKSTGISNSYITSIILGTVNVVATIGGLWIVKNCGRRKSLMIGAAWMCMFRPHRLHLPLYRRLRHDLGPLVWAVVGELYPARYRAPCMALATASNWLLNFLISFFTTFITDAIDYFYGLVFAFCCFALFWIVYFFMIETKDRSLEEIDTMYVLQVNPRKSASWDPKDLGAEGVSGVGTDGLFLKKGGIDVKKQEGGGAGLMVHDESRFPENPAEVPATTV
ncbi:hypothetical protein G7Y89_g4922 [Cudoniella acicularis]|uniref:Endo-1,4-beta-xylanase n=1 Tax=Cudoniella acicularis TaxID=354080 RepID=A0A8H4W3U8_9HELO|nr:hypothetical protein G7Y89_g4922 [Cudoniella acicularis]